MQGQRYVGWTKEFVETYDKLRPSSGPITSTPKTKPSEPIFHQITADMHDTNTVPKMIDESVLDSIQQQTELNDTNTAPKTVDTQEADMNDTNTELRTVEHETKLKTINAVSVSETAASHQSDVATCNVSKEMQAVEIAPEKCRNCAESSKLLHALTATIASLSAELSEIRQRLAVLEPTRVTRPEGENNAPQPCVSNEGKSVATKLSPSSSHEKEKSETSVKTTPTTTNTSEPAASTNAKPNVTKNVSNNNRSTSTEKKQNNTKKGTRIIGSSILHKIRTRGLQKNVHVRTNDVWRAGINDLSSNRICGPTRCWKHNYPGWRQRHK